MCSAVVLLHFVVLSAGTAAAKPFHCKKNEMAVPDDRGGGRMLCLKKSEWAKARRICEKYTKKRPVDPMGCICQDGDHVGACGD